MMPRIKYARDVDEAELEALSPTQRFERRMMAIWAHRPEMTEAFFAFDKALIEHSQLSPRLVELVRLRIAFHNQCRTCMATRYNAAYDDGLTEDLVCSLEQPYEAPGLTDAERAALRFADLFATNHLAIDDNVVDELRRHFDEGSIFELALRCSRMVGFGRLAAVLAVYEDLSGEPDADGRYTPWGADLMVSTLR